MFEKKVCFARGVRDGIPIMLGYLAVSFTLGIAARNAGLTAFQAALASLTNNASAGEFVGFTLIVSGASYFEMALMELVANARYLLMSCAMSQKLAPDTPLRHRLLIGYDLTDEIFGISMAQPGYLNPWYAYGAFVVAIPGWAVGTYLGVLMGNILPARVVSALSVGLYGMFLAVIVPPGAEKPLSLWADYRCYDRQRPFFRPAVDCSAVRGNAHHSADRRHLGRSRHPSPGPGARHPVNRRQPDGAECLSLSLNHGSRDLSYSGAAPDVDSAGDQEPVYSVVSVLCALCDTGGHDLPVHFACNGKSVGGLGGAGCGYRRCLVWMESVAGVGHLLRGGVHPGAVSGLRGRPYRLRPMAPAAYFRANRSAAVPAAAAASMKPPQIAHP